MEKTRFFEKAKVWLIGFLTISVLTGLVVLLFIPDESLAKLERSLNIFSKKEDPQVVLLNKKITELEKSLQILKSQKDNQKELEEIKNQLANLSVNNSTQSSEVTKTAISRKMVESRPITNPANLEQKSITSLNKGETGDVGNPRSEEISSKININTASLSQLDSLPGIGPTYAQRIIDYRTSKGGFKSISEIQNVKGIGPKTFEKLKDMIEI